MTALSKWHAIPASARARAACAALILASVPACSSGSHPNGEPCAIPSGLYSVTSTVVSDAGACLASHYLTAWPPPAPIETEAGTLSVTCTTTTSNGCEATCYQSGISAPTVIDYTLTSGGYAGTTSSPVLGPDGGVDDTCVYAIEATRQ